MSQDEKELTCQLGPPFSHCTSLFLVAEGAFTGVGHSKFSLGFSVTLGNLLMYNFFYLGNGEYGIYPIILL